MIKHQKRVDERVSSSSGVRTIGMNLYAFRNDAILSISCTIYALYTVYGKVIHDAM